MTVPPRPRLDEQTAGGAILVGYFIVLGVLYRDPAAGLGSATGDIASTLYFLVFPALGILTGGYAVARGPYAGVLLLLAATYLGIVGVTLALAGVAPAAVALLGIVVFGLSILSVVASIRSFIAALGIDISP